MADRDEIVAYCNDLLEESAFADYGPNGLQVHGAPTVSKIATTVSCTLDIFERAAQEQATMLLAHHGIFWKGDRQTIDLTQRARLATLFSNDINLCAYHLPLDAHDEIGNNALIRDGLGLRASGMPFGNSSAGRPIGQHGLYDEPVAWGEFAQRLTTLVDREPLIVGDLPSQVSSVAICSGGGGSFIAQAAAVGADVFITGEPKEDSRARALELGITFIAAGHYATETFGIRALGERIASQFGVEHVFLPDANPV